MTTTELTDPLIIAGKRYASRLLTGTGKFTDFAQTREASDAAGAEIITVALRRTNLGQNQGDPNVLRFCPIPPAAIRPMTPCAPVSWRGNCSMAMPW
jgi:thiazole synthase